MGALAELGIKVGRSTIQRVLAEHGIDPAPQRGGLSWKEFLAAHWGAIAAADFFTVEILRPWGLVRYHVFFAIDLRTRVVDIAGVCADPFGAWMVQIARNLTDCDGFLVGHRQLILDRDPLFTRDFRRVLRDAGVKAVRLPPRSPNLNAYAERFIRSVRRECLSKVVPLSEAHLRAILRELRRTIMRSGRTKGSGTRSRDRSPVSRPTSEQSNVGRGSAVYSATMFDAPRDGRDRFMGHYALKDRAPLLNQLLVCHGGSLRLDWSAVCDVVGRTDTRVRLAA